jgi:hypothetical protein
MVIMIMVVVVRVFSKSGWVVILPLFLSDL